MGYTQSETVLRYADDRKQEIYAVLGLFIGILACIAAYLALTPIQRLLIPIFGSNAFVVSPVARVTSITATPDVEASLVTPMPESTPTNTPMPEPTPTNTPTSEPTPTNTPTVILPPTPTHTPEPTPTNTSEPLPPGSLVDDFDVLSDQIWKTHEGGETHPGLAAVNGKLTGDGFIMHDMKVNNYMIKVRVKGSKFSIYFRGNLKSGSGYRFYCDYNSYEFQKFHDTCGLIGCNPNIVPFAPFNRSDVSFDTDTFHDLTIKVQGGQFTANLDGKNITSTTDNSYSSGFVGIDIKSGEIDSIIISPLP